jgi:hypothetical protein
VQSEVLTAKRMTDCVVVLGCGRRTDSYVGTNVSEKRTVSIFRSEAATLKINECFPLKAIG